MTLLVINGSEIKYDISKRVKLICLYNSRVSRSIPGLYKHLRNHDIIFSSLTHLNIFLALFKRYIFPKKIFIARESIVLSYFNKFQPYPGIFDFLIRKYYRYFDAIVCQSEDMAKDLSEYYRVPHKHLHVINNPVFQPKHSRQSQNSNIHFLSVGRLVEQKGFERILDALNALHDIDFTYKIVGDGPLFDFLQQKVQDLGLSQKVFLCGYSDPNIYYSQADYFLFGSLVEGFPNVLLEAASYGIPSIGYNCPGGVNEIIINEFNGFFVNQDSSIDEFATAIRKAISIKFDREMIKMDILERFSHDKIINKYSALFHHFSFSHLR